MATEPVSFSVGKVADAAPTLTVTVDTDRLRDVISARFRAAQAKRVAGRLDRALTALESVGRGSMDRADLTRFYAGLSELVTIVKTVAISKRPSAVDLFDLRDAYNALLVGRPKMYRVDGALRFERVLGPAAVVSKAYKKCRGSARARREGWARLREESPEAAAVLGELGESFIAGSLPTAPSEIALDVLEQRFPAITRKRIANIVQTPAKRVRSTGVT